MHRRTYAPPLALLALALACAAPAAARAPLPGPAAHSAATRTVKLKDSYFSPSSIRASGKATLRFVWAGKLAHNLIGRRIPKSYEGAAIRHRALTRTYGRGIYSVRVHDPPRDVAQAARAMTRSRQAPQRRPTD